MLGFRVWDRNNGCFITSGYVWFWINENGKVLESHEDGETQEIDLFFYIPMQSTGLRDSTGTEIFEGDIVRFNKPIDIEKMLNGENFGDIIVKNVTTFIINCQFTPVTHEINYKIIGNIYENPELVGRIK
jgi:uncharacterized phage protein (TIGR01671 family)